VDVLQTIRVKDLIDRIKPVQMIDQGMRLDDFKRYFSQTDQHYFPVKDENGRMVGIFSINDVRAVLFSAEVEPLVVMRDICAGEVITTTAEEDLNQVLKKFTVKNIDSLPVVSQDDPTMLIGMLSRREVIAFYNRRVEALRGAANQSM